MDGNGGSGCEPLAHAWPSASPGRSTAINVTRGSPREVMWHVV